VAGCRCSSRSIAFRSQSRGTGCSASTLGPFKLAAKVKARLQEHAAGSPLVDFDERDLFDWAEATGFQRLRLTLEAEVSHEAVAPTCDWDALLASSGNPLSPTFGELIEAALTREEAQRLERHLRPLVEAGEGVTRLAVAYLRAS
jgi:arsenite methyltransferase